MITQEPPFAVQVELTEGCNLRCSFCGINGIRSPKDMTWKFMSLHTADVIASKLAEAEGWNPRIEFAMHGEPTLNPDAENVIATFRKHLPSAPMLMLSNGGGLVRDVNRIKLLFDAGLTTLGLDQYENISLVPKIRAALDIREGVAFLGEGTNVLFYDYPSNPMGNPHQRSSYRRLVIIAPINTNDKGTHAMLNNHAGAGAPKSAAAAGKRCAKPFRELSFRWDGNVAICCNDWRGEYPIGSIHALGLTEIWDHPRMQAARKRLYHGQRDFGPCNGCDAISYRTGLLPDKKGREVLPRTDAADDSVIADALRDGPLSSPVSRSWES